jgi:hypothetical protein
LIAALESPAGRIAINRNSAFELKIAQYDNLYLQTIFFGQKFAMV